VRLEEVQIGIKVRVSDDHRRPELRGLTGTIEQTYGKPDYLALDVRLENGARELFWYYQLEEGEP
jgi:hypothetical protein